MTCFQPLLEPVNAQGHIVFNVFDDAVNVEECLLGTKDLLSGVIQTLVVIRFEGHFW